MNCEVFRDLLDPHCRLTIPCEVHIITTELSRIGLRGDAILEGRPSQANQIRCHLSHTADPMLPSQASLDQPTVMNATVERRLSQGK